MADVKKTANKVRGKLKREYIRIQKLYITFSEQGIGQVDSLEKFGLDDSIMGICFVGCDKKFTCLCFS